MRRPGARDSGRRRHVRRICRQRDHRYRHQARADAAGRARRRLGDDRADARARADPRHQGPRHRGPLAARGRAAELGQHQLLHPRLRQRRQQRRHRAFGRRVHRRRLSLALGRPDRRLPRCRPRRSAARPAVDAVRQERLGRCHLDRHREAQVRIRRQRRGVLRQLRRGCGQGRGHRPSQRHAGAEPGRRHQQARRLQPQPRHRRPHQRPRPLVRPRSGAVRADRRAARAADRRLRQDRRDLLRGRQPADRRADRNPDQPRRPGEHPGAGVRQHRLYQFRFDQSDQELRRFRPDRLRDRPGHAHLDHRLAQERGARLFRSRLHQRRPAARGEHRLHQHRDLHPGTARHDQHRRQARPAGWRFLLQREGPAGNASRLGHRRAALFRPDRPGCDRQRIQHRWRRRDQRSRTDFRRARSPGCGRSGAGRPLCRSVFRARPGHRRERPAEERELFDLRAGRLQDHRPADTDRRDRLYTGQEALRGQYRLGRRLRRAELQCGCLPAVPQPVVGRRRARAGADLAAGASLRQRQRQQPGGQSAQRAAAAADLCAVRPHSERGGTRPDIGQQVHLHCAAGVRRDRHGQRLCQLRDGLQGELDRPVARQQTAGVRLRGLERRRPPAAEPDSRHAICRPGKFDGL